MSGLPKYRNIPPGVWLNRHPSKNAAVHRYRCAVAVDLVRDLRHAVVRLPGWQRLR